MDGKRGTDFAGFGLISAGGAEEAMCKSLSVMLAVKAAVQQLFPTDGGAA